MDEKDILKALECCTAYGWFTCTHCSQKCLKICKGVNPKATLELIKSQQTEIKRLNTNMDSMVAEHSRLIANAKSEAIKEFAERLKSKCRDSIELDDYRMTVVTKLDIDDLVEGMTGGEENA